MQCFVNKLKHLAAEGCFRNALETGLENGRRQIARK